jgi:hypothetical protein
MKRGGLEKQSLFEDEAQAMEGSLSPKANSP